MIAGLLSLAGALPSLGTVNGITNAISNEKIAALTATTQQEQIASQERSNTLQMRRDVLIADATHGSWDIWIRSAIAIGPASYLLKIFRTSTASAPPATKLFHRRIESNRHCIGPPGDGLLIVGRCRSPA
jgi:hypothetical protein